MIKCELCNDISDVKLFPHIFANVKIDVCLRCYTSLTNPHIVYETQEIKIVSTFWQRLRGIDPGKEYKRVKKFSPMSNWVPT